MDWLSVFVAPIREDNSRGAQRRDRARGPFADSQAVRSLKQQWVDHRRCPSRRVLGPLGRIFVVRIGSDAQGINTQRNGTNHKPGIHTKFMRQKGGGGTGRPPNRDVFEG